MKNDGQRRKKTRATKFITMGNEILSNGQRDFLNNGQRDFILNNGHRNLHKHSSFIATGLAYLYYYLSMRIYIYAFE